MEYQNVPRGRVILNETTGVFHLYADKCILRDRKMCDRIMSEYKLPSDHTLLGPDDHYRCPACLSGKDL